MSKNKEYIKNTLILFIGKFATQFISFLLLPLYTKYLAADDYGWVDLLQSYIFLLVPVLSLRLDSAIFRFIIDVRKDEEGKRKIISNIIFILIIILFFSIFAGLIISNFIKFKYLKLTIINIIILLISNVLLQVLRGLGKNKEYSISSIITGIVCLGTNIILILLLNYGADSILISSIISNILVIIYVIYASKLQKYLSFNYIDKNIINKILKYSIPMIPNSLSWWVVNVSDRTIITFFLGQAINGIYTVSCKFSNILNSVFSVFNMSWQETASLHINDKDRDKFFSSMITNLFIMFSCISLLIIGILPFIFNLIIGKDYISSYNYIPILLYANSWNIMISLIGGIYIALKKTKEIASTTILSAIINLVINLISIKFLGLYAACISTLISYFVMSIYRYYDCKKYIKLNVDFNKITLFTIIYIISSIIYIINSFWLNLINLTFIIFYTIVINKSIIIKIYNNLKNKIKKRTKI